ncbi:DUF1365 domain-containing protein [Thalassotalea euphylliae]|uniref:DUF1365 domain-containing protein n=1 Tax=Thalassotalea euphylliae TaxID=1655234 RepID=UPI0036458028
MSEVSALKSAVYSGNVRHRRFTPAKNVFNYTLYMLALDVDEAVNHQLPTGLFGYKWFNPIRFVEKDYLRGEPGNLRQRIVDKVISLGEAKEVARITILVQVRCFGLYFSPANFFFCYDKNDSCFCMLVEVSNTPWNKRHYYLVPMEDDVSIEKSFHVSPFMDLNMRYHWRVRPPEENKQKLLVHIENKNDHQKLFDATLALNKQAFTNKNMVKVWAQLPAMTLKVVAGIYYQALKLLIKRVPFVPYQEKQS